ncbi:MAG TPA: NADH-quinone oxidoreductase subunit C, partial [Bacteroidota bacterium]|nr:NADH-quinone oxidoreductase subunit C [Bacteroidota bacterium]
MTAQELYDFLKSKFGDAIIEAKFDVLQPWIRIAPDKTKEISLFLRDSADLQFDYLSCLSGMDYNNGNLGIVYHLFSMALKHKIVIKAQCTKDHPHIQSVASVWGTANWHEREV